MFKGTEIKISTAVCNVTTFSKIDVENVFKHINVDNKIILGAKWNDNYKGVKYEKSKTGCVFNQVTIPIFIKDENKEVNLKVFSNGNLQVTGIKNIQQAKLGVEIFMDKIKNLQGKNAIDIIYKDNIAYNKDEYEFFIKKPKDRFNCIKLYDTKNCQQIGEKKSDDIILTNSSGIISNQRINVLLYHRNEFLFVEKGNSKENDKTLMKRIFSRMTGKQVGHIIYTFKYKRKTIDYNKFNFKKIDDKNYAILDKLGNQIGQEQIYIENEINEIGIGKVKKINVEYKCLIPSQQDAIYKMTNINSNFQITCNKSGSFLFLREKLNNIFIQKYKLNSSCRLDSKYPAIKLHLSYDADYNLTLTQEENEVYSNSLSIFENGQTLIFGSTSDTQMNKVKLDLLQMLNEIDIPIIRQKKIDIKIQDPTLDIWDFIKN
jgi:TATA-box binding protein (TBP) (component of TFIID and TFIIIB)